MSTNINAPASKQPSRKGKKAWRKNVDITDVQSGLEKVREEVTQFGGVIKEKEDTDLFALDLGGDEKIQKRELKNLKVLKADEILAQRSKIAPVDSRKRTNPNLTDRLIEKKKKRRNYISQTQLLRLWATANGQSSVTTLPKTKSDELYDPWDDVPAPAKEDDPKFSFLEKKQPIKAPATLRHAPVTMAAAVKSIPAVRLPDAGISYNPDFAQWAKLLKTEGDQEVEREKKRLAENAEEQRIAELAAIPGEDFMNDNEDEWEYSDQDGEESAEPRPKVDAKRKTQAQRNKEKRQKEQERQAAEKRKEKLQERELSLIRKYARDAKAQEKLRMARLIAKKTMPADDERNPKLMRKKRFGKTHLPEKLLELQLTDELTESLRRLKPEGNLISDRFHSLRERGLIEIRTPIIHAKKVKRSKTEKWSYKDFK